MVNYAKFLVPQSSTLVVVGNGQQDQKQDQQQDQQQEEQQDQQQRKQRTIMKKIMNQIEKTVKLDEFFHDIKNSTLFVSILCKLQQRNRIKGGKPLSISELRRYMAPFKTFKTNSKVINDILVASVTPDSEAKKVTQAKGKEMLGEIKSQYKELWKKLASTDPGFITLIEAEASEMINGLDISGQEKLKLTTQIEQFS